MRTLRQVPAVVGETSAGDPIFEVRSVRLLLPANATHFARVEACSRCGRELPGAAVLSPAELELAPRPVICEGCVGTAGSPVFQSGVRRPVEDPVTAPPGATTGGDARGAEPEPTVADASLQLRSPEPPGESTVDEAIEHGAAPGESSRSELPAAVEGGVDQPQAARELEEGPIGEVVAGPAASDEEGPPSDQMSQGLDQADEHVARDSEWSHAGRLEDVPVAGEAGSGVPPPDAPGLARLKDDLIRVESRLAERLEGLVEGVVAQRLALEATLDARIHQVRTTLEQEVAETGADVVRALSANEELKRAQEELRRGLETTDGRLEEMGSGIDDGALRSHTAADALERTRQDLAKLGEEVDDRLAQLEERTVVAAQADSERLHAVERQVEEAAGRLAQGLESQRAELRSELHDGLAEVRSAIPEPVAVDPDRLQALEERATRTATQLSEIDELLTILDTGFGELRAGIEQLKAADTRPIPALPHVETAFQSVDARPLPPIEPEAGRRQGKKSAVTAQLAAVSAATEELARMQRQLEAQMTALERTSDATVKSVARASSEAAALAPLRSELKTVRQELWTHGDALAKLTKSVEDLRRRMPAPERVADATPKPTPKPRSQPQPKPKAKGS